MTRDDFQVPGISCDGCANVIKRTLENVAGVGSVCVDITTKTVMVEHSETISRERIEVSLAEIGYPAT